MSAAEHDLQHLLDRLAAEQAELEREINALPRQQALNDPIHYQRLHEVSHRHARELTAFSSHVPLPTLLACLHQHPFHRDYIMQSAFANHALRKPYGYAGDKDLMLMIYSLQDQGASAYAVLKNRVYLCLPGCDAVRQRTESMYRALQEVPPGGRVLNLACGPAIEVQRFLRDFPDRGVRFDLVDHDLRTIRYTQATIPDRDVSHAIGNAFHIIKGNFGTAMPRYRVPWYDPETDFRGVRGLMAPLKYHLQTLQPGAYDLVYAVGLYDYIRDFPGEVQRGATGLTRQLFKLVKPGGRLIIGNFLAPSSVNPHLEHHRAMMEFYSEWYLLYRTPEQIRAFTAGITDAAFTSVLTDEFLDADRRALTGAIGFLAITKGG